MKFQQANSLKCTRPGETTTKLWTGFILALRCGFQRAMMMVHALRAEHDRVKNEFKTFASANLPTEEDATLEIDCLPANPEELQMTHPSIYKEAFSDGNPPVVCKFDLPEAMQITALWSCLHARRISFVASR